MQITNPGYLIEKIDNPKSIINDPRLKKLREYTIQQLAKWDGQYICDAETGEILWKE